MQSMYCLIIRACRADAFQKIKTYKSLMEVTKKYSSSNSNDAAHIRSTYLYWSKIMENFNDLFKDLTMKKNFDRDTLGGESLYHEGIRYLCEGNANHKEVGRRFKKYCMD